MKLITKHVTLQKSSFILIELLLSLSILAFISANIFYTKKEFNKEFLLLNFLENSFEKKSFDSFTTNTIRLKVIKNSTNTEEISIKKIEYKDEKLKIFKYKL